MEWVKTTAKTLPEAIDLALDNLGVDESEAEIVVLEEPKTGLFGRTRGTARVEARVKPKPIRPKNERNRNRRSRSDEGKGGSGRNRNRKGQGGEGRGNQDRSRDGATVDSDGGGRSGGDDHQGQGGRRRRRRSGQGGDQPQQTSRQGRGSSAKASTGRDGGERTESQRGRRGSGSNGGEAKPSEGATVEEVADHLRTFLTELTEAFGFDSPVSIDDSEEGTLVGTIDGRHGLLVGPKGRTLDAVQELARISCQRTAPSSIRIKVDVGGYREQRTAALADFAAKAAERAVSEGSEVALEPMSPADRKAVHDALSDDDRVETRSIGTEPRRRVLVVPLDAAPADSDPAGNGAAVASDGADDAGDGLNEVEDGPEDRPYVEEE